MGLKILRAEAKLVNELKATAAILDISMQKATEQAITQFINGVEVNAAIRESTSRST